MSGVIFEVDKRRIIPRWRNYGLSQSSGILVPTNSIVKETPVNYSNLTLSEQIKSWKTYKTLGHASDLFSSAYVLGIEEEFKDVAFFLFEHKSQISSKLLQQVERIIFPEKVVIENKNVPDFFSDEGQNKIKNEISRIRTYLKKEPKNPIGWIELGRNFLLLNNTDAAKKSVLAALQTNDTDNRYVLRSVARYFHHTKDHERAHEVIKKASNVRKDPWLLSSEIALASINDKQSRNLKDGFKLVDSDIFDPFHISELASALGTVEIISGNYKSARKLYNKALLKPNDNSIAQMLWQRKELPAFNLMERNINLPLAFEAKAFKAYYEGRFNQSYENAIRWFKDEPYSTRPIRLASYISATYQENYDKSIKLLKHGLEINPYDLQLINNVTYYLLLENRPDDALYYFKDIIKKGLEEFNENSRISLIATAGLIYYRTKQPIEGAKFYEKAIKIAKARGDDYQTALALANFAREELMVKSENIDSIMARLEKSCSGRTEDDVILLFNKVKTNYKKYKIENI